MKNLLVFIMLLTFGVSNAQEAKPLKKVETVTFTVKGNCEQCKNRIENAADIKGVKLAQWDEKTQQLTVTYRADKVTPEKIKEAVLKSGHDVEDRKAPDNTYNKLPDCCKFRDQKCNK